MLNWSGGRGVGKLVGSVVAIAGRIRDKADPRVEKIVEDVATSGRWKVLYGLEACCRKKGRVIIGR